MASDAHFGGLILGNATLGQQILDIAAGETDALIPPDHAKDNLRLELPPLEDQGTLLHPLSYDYRLRRRTLAPQPSVLIWIKD